MHPCTAVHICIPHPLRPASTQSNSIPGIFVVVVVIVGVVVVGSDIYDL